MVNGVNSCNHVLPKLNKNGREVLFTCLENGSIKIDENGIILMKYGLGYAPPPSVNGTPTIEILNDGDPTLNRITMIQADTYPKCGTQQIDLSYEPEINNDCSIDIWFHCPNEKCNVSTWQANNTCTSKKVSSYNPQ